MTLDVAGLRHLKVEATSTGLYANFNRVLVAIRKVVNQKWDGVAVTLNDCFDAGMKELDTIKGIKSGMAADMVAVFSMIKLIAQGSARKGGDGADAAKAARCISLPIGVREGGRTCTSQ